MVIVFIGLTSLKARLHHNVTQEPPDPRCTNIDITSVHVIHPVWFRTNGQTPSG